MRGIFLCAVIQFTLLSICWAQNPAPSKESTDSEVELESTKVPYLKAPDVKLTPPDVLNKQTTNGKSSAFQNSQSVIQQESRGLETKQKYFLGGTHGGGGGGGVACFSDISIDLKTASPAVVNKLLKTHLKSLFVLEYWQTAKIYWRQSDSSVFYPVKAKESPEQYLFRTLDTIYGPTSPHFVRMLKEAIQEVLPKSRTRSLDLIDDRGLVALTEDENLRFDNCIRVQLARRIFDHDKGAYRFKYNFDLYHRLGEPRDPPSKVINQALLILHEALYLIGNRLRSYADSAHIQKFINYLMQDRLSKNWVGGDDFRSALRFYAFDDFFALTLPNKSSGIHISRQKAYYSLIFKLSKLSEKFFPITDLDSPHGRALYLALPQFEREYYKSKSQDLVNEAQHLITQQIYPSLSAEQAFILAAGTLAIAFSYDFESLFIPTVDSSYALRIACAFGTGETSFLPDSMTQADRTLLQSLGAKAEVDLKLIKERIQHYCYQFN